MEWGNGFISDLISYSWSRSREHGKLLLIGGREGRGGIMTAGWEGFVFTACCDEERIKNKHRRSRSPARLCSNPKEPSSSPNGWPGISIRHIHTLLEALISSRGNQLLHITDYCTVWSAYPICFVLFFFLFVHMMKFQASLSSNHNSLKWMLSGKLMSKNKGDHCTIWKCVSKDGFRQKWILHPPGSWAATASLVAAQGTRGIWADEAVWMYNSNDEAR